MSSDTARENASVVDSSVTEWKNDMGNSDDFMDTLLMTMPTFYNSHSVQNHLYGKCLSEFIFSCFIHEVSIWFLSDNGDGYPVRSQELEHSQVADKRDKLCNTRYFIIKSLNHQNIQLSIKKGILATQVMNEPIPEEAFHNSGSVILIFSVNMSGFLHGYAQMISSVGWRRDNVWSQRSGKGNPWGWSFKVKWLCLNHLPFQKTLYLKNPLNDYKRVKISRDCQELPQDIGEALCELLDVSNDVDVSLNRDDLALKRPCLEPPYSLRDEDYNVPPLRMSWAGTPMPYNPFLIPHTLATDYFPTTMGASKFANI
ncbi:YTH domain-containing protein 1-like [Hibiscus syriacus]|uniref:YTH domain-containing protein 1-like n=1 Tax=Hibiscus syriacus TaxID=106335 RepID=UPI001921F448|nr:YTH domain-containing protein 1-like [Hibiscus syriacus]